MAPQAHAEAVAVVRAFAAAAGATIVDVAADYRWRRLSHDLRGQNIRIEGPRAPVEARLPLLGGHQIENAATALAAVDALAGAGSQLAPAADAIARGLAGVCWPGRLEVLREGPLIVADGAHNRDSARRLREALREYFACDRALFIAGTSSDKDIEGLADELAPAASRIVAVRSGHPRAMAPERIAAAFRARGLQVDVADSVPSAIDSAMAITGAHGVICLVGSLFVAAEGREYVLRGMGSGGH
jgi:dihydrofolate synthase/folylpolyglutamate synthase